MVNMNDKAEFLGQIIDIFEDFLAKRGVERFNNEPQEDNDPDNPVYIYGNDYYEIEDALLEIMERWSVIKYVNKWFYTDDMQICRKVKDDVFEFVEFSECNEKYYLAEQQKIILSNWKDSDGEWDTDAQQIIKIYYKSLDGLRSAVSPEDEGQIVAEMIYECTSSLTDELPMTEKEAEKYLENIIDNKTNI